VRCKAGVNVTTKGNPTPAGYRTPSFCRVVTLYNAVQFVIQITVSVKKLFNDVSLDAYEINPFHAVCSYVRFDFVRYFTGERDISYGFSTV